MAIKKFCITTLGCKVNQCESEGLVKRFQEMGWKQARDGQPCDLCIVNTCSVTQKAAMQSRQALRQVIRANPEANIVATGCYAQTAADEIKKIDGVQAIIGHTHKCDIPDMMSSFNTSVSEPVCAIGDICNEKVFKSLATAATGQRSRPFLKIQDGCNSLCSYCIVPYARGRSRSMPSDQVLQRMQALKKCGFHEAVLTGIHLGCYGQDLSPPTSLVEMLKQIVDSEVIDRVRLSSIEPNEISDDLIALVAESEIICHHWHIPLQSGDDAILKNMRRPYTSDIFAKVISKIHSAIPKAAIGADALIGFPGETDDAFDYTYRLVESLPITYLHVFPFSPRKGTAAYSFPNRIPSSTITERCRQMRRLGAAKKRSFFEQQVGRQLTVLVESKRDKRSGKLKGISANYVPVVFDGPDRLKNKLATVLVENITKADMVIGKLS